MTTHQRIHRTDTEWAALIAQFEDSGLSATRFCRQQGIAYGTFVRRCRAARSPEPTEPHNVTEWLPIDLTGDGEHDGNSATGDTSTSTGGWDIELSLPGGVHLRMRARA